MRFEMNMTNKKVVMAIVGIVLTSISVACTKVSGFGVDPFSVLMFGLSDLTGLTYQDVFIGTCLVLTYIAWKHNRSLLGLATAISLTCSGAVVDMAYRVICHFVVRPGMVTRIFLMIFGLVLISIASALYYTADLGVSPYDAQALTIAKKTPVPFNLSRIGTDLICLGVGYFLGGDLGVGTVIIAFCMGPFIQICREKISEPILEGRFFNQVNLRIRSHA